MPHRYPYNLDFDFSALEGLQKFSINNLGDPFIESNYGVHSREFEVSHPACMCALVSEGSWTSRESELFDIMQVGVLQWFARLWEIDQDDYWGYITNCGTEGNLHGILVGRENLPDGILYASHETHYSVFKAARMYRMDSVKVCFCHAASSTSSSSRRFLDDLAEPSLMFHALIANTSKNVNTLALP